MTEDAQKGNVQVDILLKFEEVSSQVGLGRTAIYRTIGAGTFPAPIKLGRASRWSQREVQAWMDERKRERTAS
ncbi:AlpA family phage regulatory protein [Pseudomonas sp. NBRC 100443]|uniref:helix-turn-helix transcriptional regulator n=1 Tax=Pseudomonas sp. NBRC 100443 TaxID=1113665 RepID=UPI0024A4899F|nr:AlpA family phage regulatory protein [Pseudomonas sp. NBRC 100443]GLU37128.1 hypothetical protein Pssp01_12210 [Pseudomonas sp. NBRC 100443]